MKISVSKTGLQKMQDELARLKGKEMREHLQALAEAREKGDISENAEYEVARDNINMLNIKISNLEDRIKNSVVVSKTNVDIEQVGLFTKVTIKNLKTEKSVTYSIVTEDEADAKSNKISINSPLAQGIVGRKASEKVDVAVPAGILSLEIAKIENID